MNAIHYYILDPTKNITALADTPVAPALRPAVAARIMAQEPTCEQVGFVRLEGRGAPRLEMAGGEFCGNASMAAAALYCAKNGATPGETRRVTLSVSGADRPVEASVTAQSDGAFVCTVQMPPPERIAAETLPLGGRQFTLPVVYCPGIAHIMVTKDELSEAEAARAVRDWCARLSVAGLGIMLFDPAACSLKPLVFIPAADTLVWENSCASGTGALGAYLADQTGREAMLTLTEPGGKLRVRALPGEAPLLTGTVMLCAEHTFCY